MIDHKYKVGDIVIIRNGHANFRWQLPKGRVKGTIIKLEEEGGLSITYDYFIDFGNGLAYHVAESEIIGMVGIVKEKVIFT